ncbi:polyprenyl synthetase family protein [Acidipropionibacterium jensenii]|uniref:polyprenyl synthetase family protein n=1 Tax=Acidipropionibacterium jensenii TaxID=1749 RepID=UPI0026482909|nr:polyprenyl synthetase family protein [Acidipropionibacterium jensenii]MDN5977451.1 polyprenyl synthetase family protein [Acidipropionibacterium jensenii]MDN5995199.1 polyprenyl synthetase family protein [Acidipropionibacterium jensenii]MDN6020826.1 polyprenyl synthetase family protein [Acidipropionibacterium jensenii]MDN6426778.1 polyprenyl synthetase family protein [Acidipropionibacterium jensenii]MDN6441295.1 polyprenyl synthetase family protein [Acidipropionibacterium jensenii]
MCAYFDPAAPAGDDFRRAVQNAVSGFLDSQKPVLGVIGAELEPVLAAARDYTSGGKRLRPAFCYWARVAAAGQPVDAAPLIRAAASLELLHVSALMHDDVMDHSDTRRGLPAAHRRFEAAHLEMSGSGSAQDYGTDMAILLGDLLLVWSAEMFSGSGVDPLRLSAATPLLEAVRTEVTCGQVLDVAAEARLAGGTSESALDLVNRVVEFKSARYTVVRPAQIGVSLGGGTDSLHQAMLDFGSPLGRAFQFRDDLLGVFGDAGLTGKPAGGDLREGKRTVLVAHALAASTPADAARLESLLGRPDLDDADVADARRIIERSGARAEVEKDIENGYQRAVAVLNHAEMTHDGDRALRELARQSVRRDS